MARAMGYPISRVIVAEVAAMRSELSSALMYSGSSRRKK